MITNSSEDKPCHLIICEGKNENCDFLCKTKKNWKENRKDIFLYKTFKKNILKTQN